MNIFCQVSNLLGFFPVLYCIQYRLYGFAAVLSLAVVLSILYHIDETNPFALLADTIGVSFLIALGVYTYKRSDVFMTWSNILTIIFASAGTFCFLMAGEDLQSEQYHVFHTLWHVFSMYGIGTYLYSYVNTQVVTGESGSKVLAKPVVIRISSLRGVLSRFTRWRAAREAKRKEDGAVAAERAGEVERV